MSKEETKNDTTLSAYRDAAAEYKPSTESVGTLIRAKRDQKYCMRIPEIKQFTLKQGEIGVVTYDFRHTKTNERVITALVGEVQFMLITETFDEDFEILHKGTSQMNLETSERE